MAEVIRRAVPKVPGDIGATLLSLLTPESLAIVVGTIAFGAAANLTPYGWVADAVIVGIAFGFGGLAAIHALGDLVECFKRTAGAKSDQDLDAAADALARAVVGLGVVGLMVVLHRVAARKGGAARSSPKPEEPVATRSSTRRIRGSENNSASMDETPTTGQTPQDKTVPESKEQEAGQQKEEAGTSAAPRVSTLSKSEGTLKGIPEAPPKNANAEMVRSINRQNEAAETLSQHGLDVEQLPNTGHPGPNPDLNINGETADVYSPRTSNINSIRGNIETKASSQAKKCGN